MSLFSRLFVVAALAAASLLPAAAHAHGGVSVQIQLGRPRVVVAAPPPVVYAPPPPVVVHAPPPVAYAPPPVVVQAQPAQVYRAAPAHVPHGPGPGWVWLDGHYADDGCGHHAWQEGRWVHDHKAWKRQHKKHHRHSHHGHVQTAYAAERHGRHWRD